VDTGIAGTTDIEVIKGLQAGDEIVTGSDTEEVVLRGIGPSLPLAGTLPNPKIELHDSTGALVATNDNWMDDPQKDAITSLGLAPNNALESALLAQLARTQGLVGTESAADEIRAMGRRARRASSTDI
jgi:hypothetical protein